jgi:GNAT superfamily N-acetyltransferase
MPSSLLELRPVTLDDAPLVADLETALQPDDPRDPVMMRFWWAYRTADEKVHRLINVRDGRARMFVYAGHGSFNEDPRAFGEMRVRIHPEDWSEEAFREGVCRAEDWLRAEGARTGVVKVREDLSRDLEVLARLGYDETRRQHWSRLDLVEHRERLLARAAETRGDMQRQGVELMTLDRDPDPDRWRKLYDLDVETTHDVPTTAPWSVPSFEEWRVFWFENPSQTPERFWIAREGERIVGLSVIGYPPTGGIPWTAFTSTARDVRGRGIGRALKYASIAQAIGDGVHVVQTQNDAANAPILHLNQEMGYRPALSQVEMHRNL